TSTASSASSTTFSKLFPVDFEIRQVPDDDYERLLRDVAWPAFGEDPNPEELKSELLVQEPGRAFGAVDGDAYVGSVVGVSFRVAVPGGGALPASGLTTAAVLPTHRRRGILT